MSDSTHSPTRSRRWMRRGLIAFLGTGALLVAVVLGLWAYLSNERLQSLVQAELQARLPVGTPFALEGISLQMNSGLEIHGLRIGPPPGFSLDVLRVGRLAVTWDPWELAGGTVHLYELSVEDVYMAFEENDAGQQNLQTLLAAAFPPDGEEDPDEGGGLSQPILPLRIAAPNIRVSRLQGHIKTQLMQASADRIRLQGQFAGEGDVMNATVKAHAGDAGDGDASSLSLDVFGGETDLTLRAQERLEVDATSNGFHNVAVTLTSDTLLHIQRGIRFPPAHLRGTAALSLDLLRQQLAVDNFSWRLGEDSHVKAGATLEDFITAGENMRLTVTGLNATAKLRELTPIVALFLPVTELGGDLELNVEPVQTELITLTTPWLIPLTGHASITDGALRIDPLVVSGVRITADAATTDGVAALSADASVQHASAAGQQFDSVTVKGDVTTRLEDWVLDTAEPVAMKANARMKVANAGSDLWHASGVRVDLKGSALPELLLRGESSVAANAEIAVNVAELRAGVARVGGIRTQVRAHAYDLAGRRADAVVHVDVNEAQAEFDGDVVDAPAVSIDADVASAGGTYHARQITVKAGDLIDLSASGRAKNIMGARPVVKDVELRLQPVDVDAVFSMVPTSMRPPVAIQGKLGLTLTGEGMVPYAELAQDAQFPSLSFGDRVDRQRSIAALVAYVEEWSDRFTTGLPFEGTLGVDAKGLGIAHEALEIAGVDLVSRVDVKKAGPRISGEWSVAEISRPENIRNIDTQFTLEFEKDVMHTTSFTTVGVYERDQLVRPIEGAGIELDLVYRFRGDLILNRLQLQLPDRPATASAEGLLIKPVRMLMASGWEKAGLPGLEGELRWTTQYTSPELGPVIVGAPALQGDIDVAGTLAIEDGVIKLAGELVTDKLNVRAEVPALSRNPDDPDELITMRNASGQLPFDIQLAFLDHADGTALALDTYGIGGDRLEILTTDVDIRNRPARPVHFGRLLPYRRSRGMAVQKIESPRFVINDLRLVARVEDGVLAADEISMNVLGGDVLGEMALQLSRENELLGKINFKTSHIDWSHVKELKLEPGVESEFSANIDLDMVLGPGKRDLVMRMNVTAIGRDAFKKGIEITEDPVLNAYRAAINQIRINKIAMWSGYDLVNMDLDYTSLFLPVQLPREIRRLSIAGFLDVYVQPLIDRFLAPGLGWADGS